MIPCIENKCLLYPSCMSKRSIACPDLVEYYNDTGWSGVTVFKYLPKLIYMRYNRMTLKLKDKVRGPNDTM